MHTVKWIQALLFIFYLLLSGLKYSYSAQIILVNIIHSFTHS